MEKIWSLIIKLKISMRRKINMYDNIIISGGFGRIGCGLVEKLAPLVNCIYLLDIDNFGNENLQKYKNVKFMNYAYFLDKFNIPSNSLFIHAGFARKNLGDQLSCALELTADLFSKLSHFDIHIINISSQAVYVGNQPTWTEDFPRYPKDLYGLAKTATEVMIKSICSKNLCTNIRLSALSGVKYPEHILYKMVDSAIKTGFINIKGDNKYFSFMDYKDAINAFSSIILSNDKNWGAYYNVGNSSNYNIFDIANEILSRIKVLLNKNAEIVLEENDLDFNYKMDASRFENQFSWKPEYSITDTIDEIILKISKNNSWLL